jgi:hypothetical protein
MMDIDGKTAAPSRPFDLAALAVTGVAAGGVLGAAVNAVNGRVSPLYFVTILGWGHLPRDEVWRASVARRADKPCRRGRGGG